MKKVAVIGGGLMGSGIATALLLSNVQVVLKEVNAEFLAKGIKSVEGTLISLSNNVLFFSFFAKYLRGVEYMTWPFRSAIKLLAPNLSIRNSFPLYIVNMHRQFSSEISY